MKKICETCKEEFNAEENKTKFCSRKCFVNFTTGIPRKKRARITKICLGCGKEFSVYKSWEYRKYCSRLCKRNFFFKKNKTIIEDVNIKCIYCGKEFIFKKIGNVKLPIYCSAKCRSADWYYSKTKECIQCGKPLKKTFANKITGKFCSGECRKEAQQIDLEFTKRQGVKRKLKRMGVIFEKCADCGYNKYPQILGIHHGDENPTNHSIGNLIILCPNCHSIRHNRHLIKPAGHLSDHPH